MDYSLLSRFRGAWLGSLLAADVKEQNLAMAQDSSLLSKTGKKGFSLVSESKLIELAQRQWRSLQNHWGDNCDVVTSALDLSQSKLKVDDLALLALPTIMFYHDYWSYLQTYLHAQAEVYQLSSTSRDCLLVWAYIFRLGLRGELTQPNLTSKILQEANIPSPSAYQWLSSIEVWCKQGHSLQKLLNNYTDQGALIISLSLFNFWGNLADFRLSTQQGSELIEPQQIMLAALGGALSGAYNGLSIIPSNWRNSCHRKKYYQFIISKTKDIMREWSGLDYPKENTLVPSILTSAGILQPRHNLNIISQ